MNTHRVIYIAASVEQAHILANALREHGIFAYVSNEALQFGVGELPMGLPTAARVVVDEDDADLARHVALAFDRAGRSNPSEGETRGGFQFGLGTLFYIVTCAALYLGIDTATEGTLYHEPACLLVLCALIVTTFYLVHRRYRVRRNVEEGPSSEELDELEAIADRNSVDWPECPHCRRPRQTSCPVCETAGTKFAQAFMPDDASVIEPLEGGDRQKLLVLCPTCDEPFAPEFLARCEWCGHRFGDGREPAVALFPSALEPEVNGRVWIVIVGLAIVLAATLAYLAQLAPPR